MTQYQPDEKNRIKRQKSDSAIRLAAAGRWEEAVHINRELLAIFPDDSETLNRLGKAYLELKRFTEAKEAYEQAVKSDPGNTIAQKNLQRLVQAIATSGTKPASHTTREKPAVAPSAFIEETGKTGVTSLIRLAPVPVLARLTAGDPVTLEVNLKSQTLLVKNEEGEVLGQVEPKLALRLIRFIESGNRYVAAVTSVTERALKVILREIFQAPSQRGRLSFPPKTTSTGYRAYIKDSAVLRYGYEEEDENFDENESLEANDDDGDDDEADSFSEELNDDNEQDEI
ncbi:MAG: tetratricopeptide repeat protein [Chloroflexota bacterium]|nr:tetratricopeptide repeat protein [Chloroflexota bacterium]